MTLIRNNLRSGVITGMGNFPLSIAMAVASNSTPEAGIISSILGGLI
jgi:MFS superfamily sulfate permease-like transporter